MTPAVQAKAARLLREHRIHPRGAASVYDVRGDTGTYQVAIGDGFAVCTCPAKTRCSHIAAGEALVEMASERGAVV